MIRVVIAAVTSQKRDDGEERIDTIMIAAITSARGDLTKPVMMAAVRTQKSNDREDGIDTPLIAAVIPQKRQNGKREVKTVMSALRTRL
jgi:hypothetical protein